MSVQRRRTTVTTTVDRDRGVFMISVAAELSEEQSEAIEKFAEASNGSDPRAELLRKAGV